MAETKSSPHRMRQGANGSALAWEQKGLMHLIHTHFGGCSRGVNGVTDNADSMRCG